MEKNTKPCRCTKIARNAEINDPGSCYESGPMIHALLAARSPTWRPIGPGSCWNRDRHWSRIIDPGSTTGTNGLHEPGP
jgi:hypothetical protein